MQKKQEQQSLTKVGQENNITTARNKGKNYNKISHRFQHPRSIKSTVESM